MELSASEIWAHALAAARSYLPEQSFQTWLSGTEAVGFSDNELLVEAPSQFHVEWIEDKYGAFLRKSIEQRLGRPLSVSYRSSTAHAAPPAFTLAPGSPSYPSTSYGYSIAEAKAGFPSDKLNERYTFDRFVVGNNNQLAVAACRAVADKPARMYNPLFVYGGVGLGKTHLMHAIGNYLQQHAPELRIAYVPTEQFTNELVTSIQEGATPGFRRRYRLIDLLLVDDIHFLEGKERTQEEFFHTFNALYDAQKQIVLTSDRAPNSLPGLEDRLVSRFAWGLVADIKPPDYETRIAIVRKKAAYDGLFLEDDVIDLVARSCTSSVREMEGAIIKLLAFSSLTNQEITLALAHEALKETRLPTDTPSPSMSLTDILRAAARAWGVEPKGLVSKRRTRDLTVPRQVAMYLIKEILDPPLTRIGEAFGGRDHSTVIHSIRKVDRDLQADEDFAQRVSQLRAEILRRGV
jgi:chromosomal replication initiator protein